MKWLQNFWLRKQNRQRDEEERQFVTALMKAQDLNQRAMRGELVEEEYDEFSENPYS